MPADEAARHNELRHLLGGYVLGGLDSEDRARLDRHMRECPSCRNELAELAPVRLVLDRNRSWLEEDGEDEPAVDPAAVDRLLERAAATRRPRPRGRLLLAAAAAILAVAAVGVGVSQLAGSDDANGRSQALHSVTSATGTIAVEQKPWGTALHLEARGLTYAGDMTLQVRSTDGRRETAASWGPTPTGICVVDGATSIDPGDIASLSVRDAAGRDVMWVDLS